MSMDRVETLVAVSVVIAILAGFWVLFLIRESEVCNAMNLTVNFFGACV
jgi:hypothetical protein